MSRTYSLACVKCKKSIWIGQVSGGDEKGHIYSGMGSIMSGLNDFLWDHAGHSLIYSNDELLDDYEEIDIYEPRISD